MKDSEFKLLSIGMITYNHEPYIRQAIESVLQQRTTFKIELVIGEDCSKDSTRSICDEYALSHPHVVKLLPSVKNLGVTPNFIRTLLACSGDFIALCEGDDYWTDPLKLQKQVDFLISNSEFVASFHSVQVIDQHGIVVRNSKSSFLYDRDVTAESLMNGKVLSLSSICFRNVITEFPEEFYKSPTGDNFLCSLLGNYGGAKFLKEIAPSAYRIHDGGICSLKTEWQKKKVLLKSYFLMWQYYDRIGKAENANGFYRKIILEGFYSNPYADHTSGALLNLEVFIVRWVRKTFRLLRWLIYFRPKESD